jgi:hypothetical protein
VHTRDIPIPLAGPAEASRSQQGPLFRAGATAASTSTASVFFLLVIGALVGGIALLAMSVARPDVRRSAAPSMPPDPKLMEPLGAVPPVAPLSPVVLGASETPPAGSAIALGDTRGKGRAKTTKAAAPPRAIGAAPVRDARSRGH